jgi:hypothetical protein
MATKTTLNGSRYHKTEIVTDASDFGKRHTIVTEQNVDPILRNVRMMKENAANHKKDLRPVAEVPMAIVEKAMIEGWYNDPAAWRKWLNDPDNKAFRVWEGKV